MKLFITNITAILLMVFISSCTEEAIVPTQPSANQAVVHFALPKKTLVDVGAATRSDKNELEKTITNIDLFVVEVTTEGEVAPADDAEVLSHYTSLINNEGTLSININQSSKPRWLVAIVNATDKSIIASTFSDLNALSESTSALYSSLGTSYADQLPMYAMQYFNKIEEGITTLDLEHICSRIEVISSEPDYVLETVTLLNGATSGYYIPRDPMEVATVSPYLTTVIEDTPYIYLFENNGGTADAKNYTDIIIGGKYTISEGNIEDSYIKVKLEYGSPLTADIVRNTNFKVNLKEIKNSIGYKTIEEAQAGEYSDAKVSIDIDADALTDLVVGNGDYYMSFSNSEYRAYIPTGTKNDLTAFTLRFDKSTNSDINIATVKKEMSLGAASTGITIVGDVGDKTSEWTAATDIPVLVNLTDNASGSIIVRIGNLIKEIKIVRETNATNLPTVFHDGDYIYARFESVTPSWLKIATKTGEPEVTDELHSSDGFTLQFDKDLDASQSSELYLYRGSNEGRTKVYVEQYTVRGTPIFNVSGLGDNTDISYAGANISTNFAVSESTATIDFLDETQHSGNTSWEAEFSYDGGMTWTTAKPEWIDMPTSGDGPLSASTISAAIQKVILTGEALVAENTLKAATAKGSLDAPYNLANNNDVNNDNESTANSYLVGAAGTYKLPLIYGNARRDGKANAEAYEGSTFVKHDRGKISKPEIDGAANAILAWQDTPGLITDIQLSSDSDYLVFTVPHETIMEGNAVLAVRNASDKILWSWHIWVTPYTLEDYKEVEYKTTTSITGTSKMLDVNLGWCSPGTIQYGENSREIKVRLKQLGGTFSPSSAGVTYSQNIREKIESMGNCPFYQYGRKDPMLPSDGSGDNDKVQFGNLRWKVVSGPATLDLAIQNPNVLYFIIGNWCSTTYNNLWSAKNSIAETIHIADHVKTVYDPSPVGYVVPPTSYFSGFTTTGEYSETISEFNVKGSFDKGYDFYCALNKTGSTIHLPAVGCRFGSNGSLGNVSTLGYCWSASPYGSTHGYTLSFLRSNVSPSNDSNRAPGFPIRPVQEYL